MNLLKQLFPFIFGKPTPEPVVRLTMLEILDETVAYYSSNPRASHNTLCYFNGPDGTHCAVGRCMLPEYKNLGDKLLGNRGGINDLLSRNNKTALDDILEPKYHGNSVKFWVSLQLLHDIDVNWSSASLSDTGRAKVASIREDIESGKYCPIPNDCN